MQYDDFLSRLDGVHGVAGGFVARCPAHNDLNPSLSVTDAGDRILVYCHAGCDAFSIVSAMGLELRDLYYGDFYQGRKITDQPQSVYDYVDENGNLLYQVVRFPLKRFTQRSLQNGQWVWSMKDVRKVLYRLDRLVWYREHAPDAPIYIVGGEKDADNIMERGLMATTNVGGEGKWLASYPKYFKDADVIIVADKDEVGMKHALDVYGSLVHPDPRFTIVRSAKIVQAKEGKDVTDHLNAGYRLNQLEEVRGG